MKTFIVKATYPNGEEVVLWEGEAAHRVDAVRTMILDNYLVAREFWTPSNLIVCFSEYEIMKFHGYGSEDLYDEVAQWIGDMSGVDVSELPGHWLVKLFDELKIEEVDSQ